MSSKLPIKALVIGSQFYIDRTVASLVEQAGDCEEHSYFADELNEAEFFNTLYTPSLFHDYKLIIVSRAETIKKIDGFVSNLSKATDVSIIISTTDLKKGEAWAASLQPLKFIVYNEGKVSEAGKSSTIKAIFAENNLKITDSCASQIGILLQWDLSSVLKEAEKLSLYFAYKPEVSEKELINQVNGEPQEQIFAVIAHFMARNQAQCVKAYSLLPDMKSNAAQIFSMLVLYVAGLYFKLKVPELYNKRNPLFNNRDYFMRSVDANYRKWKFDEVYDLIEEMTQLDLQIKTGRIESGDALLLLMKYL